MRLRAMLTGFLLLAIGHGVAAAELLPPPEMGEDGLHKQPWFVVAPVDLAHAPLAASRQDKMLAIFWEQRGCAYCARMHNENLRDPEIVSYITTHFQSVQADIHGKGPATAGDGTLTSERDLARANRVAGTPTVQFLDGDGREVFRMPGYAEPPVFMAVFEYVATRAYRQAGFRDWIAAKIARIEAAGKAKPAN